ncbi:hypothetical protein [Tabrizicola sp. BL-A-41-H6]|uniref:hypothetical protein n=1 Tax=Tabrizicola sp. BL-A-41-H6 TaxID=3421107 RepID=UPI003D678AB8
MVSLIAAHLLVGRQGWVRIQSVGKRLGLQGAPGCVIMPTGAVRIGKDRPKGGGGLQQKAAAAHIDFAAGRDCKTQIACPDEWQGLAECAEQSGIPDRGASREEMTDEP